MILLRQAFEDRRLSFTFILLAVVFIYLPNLGIDFLHTDDWFWSYWGGASCPGVVKWILPIGRPLAGLIFCIFPLVTSFKAMWIFRLVSIFNIALIGYLLWRWLVRWKVESSVAVLVTLSTVTLPAFQVYSSYISTLPHCFALTPSFLAILFVEKSFQKEDRRFKMRNRAYAILLLLVALSLNQATALFYVGTLAVPILMTDSKNFVKELLNKLFIYAGVLAAALAVYYLAYRLSADWFNFRNVEKYDGRNFVSDYAERFIWFFSDPLYEASNLWFIHPTSLFSRLVLLLMSGVVAWEYFKEKAKRAVVYKYLAAFLLFPVGYAISLVSSAPSPEYRTYPAIGSLFVFFLFLGSYFNAKKHLKKKGQDCLFILFFLVTLGSSITAHKTVAEYFVYSDSAEFRFVKNEIRNYVTSTKELKEIHFITARGPIGAPQKRNEIGEPTIRFTRNIEPLVRAALAELDVVLIPKITTSKTQEDPDWMELVVDREAVKFHQVRHSPSQDGVLIIDISKFRFS